MVVVKIPNYRVLYEAMCLEDLSQTFSGSEEFKAPNLDKAKSVFFDLARIKYHYGNTLVGIDAIIELDEFWEKKV